MYGKLLILIPKNLFIIMSAEMLWSLNEQSKLAQYGEDVVDTAEHLERQKKFEQECLERIEWLKVGAEIDFGNRKIVITKIDIQENNYEAQLGDEIDELNQIRIVYYNHLSGKSSGGFCDYSVSNTIFIKDGKSNNQNNDTILHELGHLKAGMIKYTEEEKKHTLYGFRENNENGNLIEELHAINQEIDSGLYSSNIYRGIKRLGNRIFKKIENLSDDDLRSILGKYNYSQRYINDFVITWNGQKYADNFRAKALGQEHIELNSIPSKNQLLMEIFHNARYVWSDRMMLRELVNELSDGLFQRWFEGQINLEDIARLQAEVDVIDVKSKSDKSISSNFGKR